MALIKCPECGKDVSDKAPICPHCGYNPNVQTIVCPECGNQYSSELANCPQCGFITHCTTKIVIHGYNEKVGKAPVKVSIEGRHVGTIERGGTLVVEIDHDCIIDFNRSDFRNGVRSTRHAVKVGQTEQIMLSINRMGGLSACNTTKENYVSVIFHPVKIILPNNPIRSISPLKLLEAYTYGDCHGVRSASGSMLVNLPVVA